MAQHKKKATPHQTQKIVAAQYRKEFFRKLKHVIDTCCGTDIYPLIPKKTLDSVYIHRSTPFLFKIADNCKVAKNIYDDTKVVLTNIFKDDMLIMQPNNLEISLFDYFTVLFNIVTLSSYMSETDFKDAKKVKEALKPLLSDQATYKIANEKMYNILLTYGYGEGELSKSLFWLKHIVLSPKFYLDPIKNIIEIHTAVPQTISVKVDGISRPAIRAGWAFAHEGCRWLSLKPSVLKIKSPFAKTALDVYIQSHALLRLTERVDCFMTGIMHFNLYCSLAEPKVCYDSHKNILIEYIFFGTKVGYFRADIVDGIILIRTFLFLTNNSTPEGQLLEKNTGLQKLDKKYLALDKLSTFMTSDIGKNDGVRKILISSGCRCLLDLYERMRPILTKKDKKFDTDLMLNYVNYDAFNMPDISEDSLSGTSITDNITE